MKDIFNPKRFASYLVWDIRSLWANYGLNLMLLGLMPLIVYFFAGVGGVIWDEGRWAFPPEGVRLAVYVFTLVFLLISAPVKLYGSLTEKKAGSAWLMLPASTLEKFLSMLVVTIFVAPLAFLVLHLASDALVTVLPGSYADQKPLLHMSSNLLSNLRENFDADVWVNVPLSLLVNVTINVLVFLLGALIFKKAKVAKTILCLLAISFILTSTASIIILHTGFTDWLEVWTADHLDWLERQAMHADTWINVFLHTVNIILIGGLGTAVFFRLKTLKH